MLDADTKRRIDSCRDILVGKVPDPKSQVEQITIALIYKFMDDMDAEAEELGGTRTFFAGAYARFGWAQLMAPGLGGFEVLALYSEAIQSMRENPGVPELFRDIFKNAYLPYRDPETLKSFLKEINHFTYDHSERLGDAFEYLLSVLGSQGDAGQFRTPRHIIDFMVAVLDPQKTDTILDPACGTAGFLISAWKHILAANTKTGAKGTVNTLTSDERARLTSGIRGYDISPDMVRLSLVNLYLHGFPNPHIAEYDTLTQDDKWNELADVILANPPFMSPKGGIKPHKRFSVQATRSEVLFVDYMAEHLTATGRAAIVVPEGIVFQSGTAYKALRKMLVDTSLVAVISLPAGVFNPYSGVKTSILILDKRVHKQTDSVLFVKVQNDGFSLGAQRRAVANSDLPEAKRLLRRWNNAPRAFDGEGAMAQVVARSRIREGGGFNLSGERYLAVRQSSTTFPLISIGSFMKTSVSTLDPRSTPEELFELWSIPAHDAGAPEEVLGSEIGSAKKLVYPDEMLLSRIIPHIRRARTVRGSGKGLRQLASTEWIVFSSTGVVPEYLRRIVLSDQFHGSFMRTITGVGGSLSRANPEAVGEIQIPVPPLEIQRQIAAEIEDYQKVIDGARQVVSGYRPRIAIDSAWRAFPLADICSLSSGGTPSKANPDYWVGDVPWVSAKDMKADRLNGAQLHVSETAVKESSTRLVHPGSLLILVRGMGLANGVPICEVTVPCAFNQDVKAIEPATHVNATFLRLTLQQQGEQFKKIMETAAHGTLKINTADLLKMQISLPDLATQRAIVGEIDAEQALVNVNRELIRRMEAKIKAAIDRVWGDEVSITTPASSAPIKHPVRSFQRIEPIEVMS